MKVIIIGGGPAGSLSAIRLIQKAADLDRELRVIVYEAKPFKRRGPVGCNFCAGVITARTVEKLHDLGIELPPGVIQRRIESFYYVTEGGETELVKKNHGEIYSVFRGGGPRHLEHGPESSFDRHLLQRAEELGAEVREERVSAIEHRGRDSIAVIGAQDSEEHADLVIGAFGVNSALAGSLKESLGYSPPKCVSVAQAEFEMDEGEIERVYGNRLFAFALRHSRIRFLAVTPKRRYLTITAVGKNPSLDDLIEFVRHPRVAPFFKNIDPEQGLNCNCSPRMPVGFARGAVSSRFLAVGDAFTSRYYKNGLGSALFSADAVAEFVINGIPGKQIAKAYRSRMVSRFSLSNRCGKILFFLNDITHKTGWLSRATLAYLERENQKKGGRERRFNNLMWSLFAGDRSYCRIMGDSMRPGLVLSLLLWHTRSVFKGIFHWLLGRR